MIPFPNRRRPRGVAAVWTIVVLATVTALSAAAARQIASLRRATDAREAHLQAVWLARSGVELAVAKLAADAAYTGETVRPVPGGECRIAVRKVADGFAVTCEARYANGLSATAHTETRTVKPPG